MKVITQLSKLQFISIHNCGVVCVLRMCCLLIMFQTSVMIHDALNTLYTFVVVLLMIWQHSACVGVCKLTPLAVCNWIAQNVMLAAEKSLPF